MKSSLICLILIFSSIHLTSCGNVNYSTNYYQNNVTFLDSELGEWFYLSEMPTARSEISGVKLDSRFYVVGGFEKDAKTSSAFEVYNLDNDTWEVLDDIPYPVHHVGISAYDGKIYISGGWSGLDFVANINSFWSYDVELGTWEKLENMIYPRAAHRMVEYNGSIYVIGGVGPNSEKIFRYNIENDTWDIIPSKMSYPRDHFSKVLIDNELYIISGRDGSSELGIVEIFDFEDYSITRIKDIPFPRGGHVSEYLNNRIYVFGGELIYNDIIALNSTQVYDLTERKWYNYMNLPVTLHGSASTQYNNKIYIFGGAFGPEYETFTTLSNNTLMYEPG